MKHRAKQNCTVWARIEQAPMPDSYAGYGVIDEKRDEAGLFRASSGMKKQIPVVDANQPVRETRKKALAGAGYEVVVAAGGLEGGISCA